MRVKRQAPGAQPRAQANGNGLVRPDASVAQGNAGLLSLEESIRRRTSAQLFHDLRIMGDAPPKLDHVLGQRRRITLAILRERLVAA